jgi:hypothetical protein
MTGWVTSRERRRVTFCERRSAGGALSRFRRLAGRGCGGRRLAAADRLPLPDELSRTYFRVRGTDRTEHAANAAPQARSHDFDDLRGAAMAPVTLPPQIAISLPDALSRTWDGSYVSFAYVGRIVRSTWDGSYVSRTWDGSYGSYRWDGSNRIVPARASRMGAASDLEVRAPQQAVTRKGFRNCGGCVAPDPSSQCALHYRAALEQRGPTAGLWFA